ncbi:hypothetical protein J4464_06520 [Candidatus Woesearchaeota archaeon]|nr:hypothetical protein [Candidatus Woesearchaeota archaeon]
MPVEEMGLEIEESKQLQAVRAERQQLSAELYSTVERSTEAFRHLGTQDLSQEELKGLSKLDKGLARSQQFSVTMAELAAGVQQGLDEYVACVSNSQTYQGPKEKLLKLGGVLIPRLKRAADRARIQRVSTQTPKQNLDMIVSYSDRLHQELCEARDDSLKVYFDLDASLRVATTQIAELEPKVASAKTRHDTLRAAYEAKHAEFERATDPALQARLGDELAAENQTLVQAKHEYDQLFTRYNQAQQAIAPLEKTRDAFSRMQSDLGKQATMLKSKMEHASHIYAAAPRAVLLVLKTKGMEMLDRAINTATDQSVDTIVTAAEGIADTTLSRTETDVISEEAMRGYIQRWKELTAQCAAREAKIEQRAARSQAERYAEPQ